MEEYKFQKLQLYQLALKYADAVYELSEKLPLQERFILSSQMETAATSIVLNFAEGSAGQTDPEQNRLLSLALHSYLETVACIDLIEVRGYSSTESLSTLREQGRQLFIKLSALQEALSFAPDL